MSPGPIPRKLSDANCLVPSRSRRVRLWRRLSSLSRTPVGNRESQNGGAADLTPWLDISFLPFKTIHKCFVRPKYSMIPTEKSRFFVEQSSKPFFSLIRDFCHFLPGLELSRWVPSLLCWLALRELAWGRGWTQMNTAVCPRSTPLGTVRFTGTFLAAKRDGCSVFSGLTRLFETIWTSSGGA